MSGWSHFGICAIIPAAITASVVPAPHASVVQRPSDLPRSAPLTPAQDSLLHRLRVAEVHAVRAQPWGSGICLPKAPVLVAAEQSWDPLGADLRRLLQEIGRKPLKIDRDSNAMPCAGQQALSMLTAGEDVAGYAQDPFTPTMGPPVRRRMLLNATAPWAGFFLLETGRFGGELSIVAYRSDGARLWSVIVFVLSEGDAAGLETMISLRDLTRWSPDELSPPDSDSLRTRTADVVHRWLARGPKPTNFVARPANDPLPRPVWPDSTPPLVVWRSKPGSGAISTEKPVHFRLPPVVARDQNCDPPPEPKNPWQPNHSHDLVPYRMEDVKCDSTWEVVAAFEALRKPRGGDRPKIVRRVCDLPLPARQALAPHANGVHSDDFEVADFDQAWDGGCIQTGRPSRKLMLAECTPAGGWLLVWHGGLFGAPALYVYGARNEQLQWLTHLQIEPRDGPPLSIARQLSHVEDTPEGREAAAPLVHDVAKVIAAHIGDVPPPTTFLLSLEARSSQRR